MERGVILVLLIVVSVYGCVDADLTCGDMLICGEGEGCCHLRNEHTCYDPYRYSCLNSTNVEGSGNDEDVFILCGFINGDWYPARVCGEACYDGQFYSCCNNRIYDKFDPSANPCLTPPQNDAEGCSPSCAGSYACCNDTLAGPICFDPRTHACVNDYLLCGLYNGVPALACGSACYNASAYQCCDGILYSQDDRSNPCRSQVGDMTLFAEWESKVVFNSRGFQSPPDGRISVCDWSAFDSDEDSTAYELYNCTSITGSGAFRYNESYYVLSFGLPMNTNIYSSSSLSIYVDNALGRTQPLAVSVFDELLEDSFNETGSNHVRSCTSYKVFQSPLFIVNTTVEQGFVGYISVDATPLLTWFAATGNSYHTVQLAISALNVCACLESSGRCIYTLTCQCDAPDYHLKLGRANSANPPTLYLS